MMVIKKGSNSRQYSFVFYSSDEAWAVIKQCCDYMTKWCGKEILSFILILHGHVK